MKGIDALLKAKERYEDGVSCGDVISKALECFRTGDGLDVARLTKWLKDNGCKVPNVDMQRHGSTGRFRMVAGLMLRAAARKRPVKIGGQTLGEGKRVSPLQSVARRSVVAGRRQRRANGSPSVARTRLEAGSFIVRDGVPVAPCRPHPFFRGCH